MERSKNDSGNMKSIKDIVKFIISIKLINVLLVWILRKMSCLLPISVLVKVPLFGIFSYQTPARNIIKLVNNGDDRIVSKLIFNGREGFEPETTDLFLKIVNTSRIVFDIGANTGIYTLLAASENPSCTVHAFEPVPKIYDRLNKNVQLNNFDNITINQTALTNQPGTTDFFVSEGLLPTSSSSLKGFRNNTCQISVKATTIDEYVVNKNLSEVDLLKIDTEATEPDVLHGAKIVLHKYQPLIICEVLYGRTESELHRLLDRFNYRYFWITNDGLIHKDRIQGDQNYMYLNYLFVPENSIDFVKTITDMI